MEIRIEALNKFYGSNHALCDFMHTLTPGIYGLLGPNGAGKSTLMGILSGNLRADGGTVLLDGESIEKLGRQFRKILGYMPQQQNLYSGFTLRRFLLYMAALKGIKKGEAKEQVIRAMEAVNLLQVQHQRLSSFSGGMKQRALLAQAILGNPRVLILDEPTAGLDPKERIRIRNLIAEIALNRIVVLATHVVPDIEFIASEVLLMDRGKLIKSGSPNKVCQEIEGSVYEMVVTVEDVQQAVTGLSVTEIVRTSEGVRIRFVSKQLPKWECSHVTPTLEDVYLYYFSENSEYWKE